jgi:acetyl-CoA acetyltransferase
MALYQNGLQRLAYVCADAYVNIVDVTESGHSVAGKRAFAMAGIGPRDVASFHPYDDFIIAIMLQLEMLGFCKHGQGCDFIKETDFAHTGNLPLNTGGGQISAGQAGLAGGGTNLIEGCVSCSVTAENGRSAIPRTQLSPASAAFPMAATGPPALS